MSIQSDITNEDWTAYSHFIRRQVKQGAYNKKMGFWLPCIGFGIVLGLIISIGKISIDPVSIMIGSFGMAFLIFIIARSQLQSIKPALDGIFLGPNSVSISDEGIRTFSANYDSLYRWKTVRNAQVTDKHIFIIVDTIAAIMVPRRSFSSDIEREQFLDEIQKHSSP
jgi:hypothetical protein